MVILAADARPWPPRTRPVPAAGRADRARGPVLPGRGTHAREAQTPHRIGTMKDVVSREIPDAVFTIIPTVVLPPVYLATTYDPGRRLSAGISCIGP